MSFPFLNPPGLPSGKGAAKTLFIKIFLWFWLAMALSGVVIVFLTATAQIGPIARAHKEMQIQREKLLGSALLLYGESAARAYNRGGRSALAAMTAGVESSSGTRLYLFEGGNSGEGKKSGLFLLPRGKGKNGKSKTSVFLPQVAKLAAKAFHKGGASMASAVIDGEKFIAALPFAQSDARGRHEYVIAGQWPFVPFSALIKRGSLFPLIFGFRQLIYLVVGGVICYVLAWQLTAPIRRLRHATQRLAAGDLKVRVGRGGLPAGGGDEIAALGRDFDSMAERMEALLDAQRRLIRDISHELRSPLARLNVALELAKRNEGEKAAGALDRIEKEAERLNALIAQLVTLTLLESGTERLEKTKVHVNLGQLVMSIADDARYEAAAMGRQVFFNVVSMPETVIKGSPEMLRSAIENVVRNAVRYTPQGSSVEITLRGQSRDERFFNAVITVRDHGPGVPEQALAHLFEPFYRADDARDRASGGAGVGLAITKRAVHLHGGQVSAMNAPDGGLVTEISLPLGS